jgi:hypothetical protein
MTGSFQRVGKRYKAKGKWKKVKVKNRFSHFCFFPFSFFPSVAFRYGSVRCSNSSRGDMNSTGRRWKRGIANGMPSAHPIHSLEVPECNGNHRIIRLSLVPAKVAGIPNF